MLETWHGSEIIHSKPLPLLEGGKKMYESIENLLTCNNAKEARQIIEAADDLNDEHKAYLDRAIKIFGVSRTCGRFNNEPSDFFAAVVNVEAMMEGRSKNWKIDDWKANNV